MIWAALPLVEVGFYDRIFDRKHGFEIIDSSLMIHAVAVFGITAYIDFITRSGFPPIDALYLSLAEEAFRLGLLIVAVYAFLWYLNRDISRMKTVENE